MARQKKVVIQNGSVIATRFPLEDPRVVEHRQQREQQEQAPTPHIVAIVVTPIGYKQGADALGNVWSRFYSDRPYPCYLSECDKRIHDGWYCETTRCFYCAEHITHQEHA